MLSTLRIIIINNNKKIFGSLLMFANTMIWILGTSLVIVDITHDLPKIFVFALGSSVGSYLGSLLEEKLALGTNLIICISKKNLSYILSIEGYATTVLKAIKNKNLYTHFIITPRYKSNDIISVIRKHDKEAIITKENTSHVSGGYF